MKIVVFDSGRGSVYATKLLKDEFPDQKIINYQDKNNFPYGEKSTKELCLAIARTIIYIEKRFKPDIIVMASITPSLEVLKSIRESKLSKAKIIGAKLPLSKTKGQTTIIATSRTIKSLKKNSINCIAVPNIINLIQSKDRSLKKETEIMAKQLPYFDTLILGSTHMGYIKKFIQKIYPDKLILDSYDQILKDVKKAILAPK